MFLYEKCTPLTTAHGDMRIFAPIAYPRVRQAQIVPIVHIEAFALASWFPICWHAGDPRPTLVVLRSLRRDGACQPPGSPEAPASLPLALRAYPFVVGAMNGHARESKLSIADAIPDQPTDVGAPIMTPEGKAGRGAQMRLRAVAAYIEASEFTVAMTDHLHKSELLEPWPLEFEVSSETIAVPNLLVVRQDQFDSPKIFRFIKELGPVAASFLGAHRISLFRAGVLVQAARSAADAPPVN